VAEGSVPVEAVRDLVRKLHSTASQEAAAARIALAVWRRAVARGDAVGADTAVAEAVARFEALFDELAALEAEGKRLVEQASETG
jgi:hypothetical protein